MDTKNKDAHLAESPNSQLGGQMQDPQSLLSISEPCENHFTSSFKMTLGTHSYTSKPTNWGAVTNDFKAHGAREVEYDEFLSLIEKGYCWSGACQTLGVWANNDGKDFISQQVFGVDIDNAFECKDENGKKDKRALQPGEEGFLDPLDALRRCVELKKHIEPICLYATFSSTEKWPRFRLVFLLDEPVTDYNDACEVLRWLMGEFPECDKACSNPNRLYAGTSYGNVIPLRGLLCR